MELNATRSPLDFEAITKGSIIPVDVVEKATRKSRNDPHFNFAALSLAGAIKSFHKARGETLVIVNDHGSLRVLLDNEQSAYCAEDGELVVRRYGRRLRELVAVNVANLTPDERAVHERRVISMSKQAQALAQAGARIRLPAWKPSRPGLPGAEQGV